MLVLVGSFLGGVPADLVTVKPALLPGASALGLALILLYGAVLASAWKGLDPPQQRQYLWLIAGAALSLLPSLGGFPGGRLLLMPSLGGVAMVALLLAHAYRRAGTRKGKALLLLLVGLQVLRPPIAFVAELWTLKQYATAASRILRESELPASPEAAVVVLAASDLLVSVYTGAARLMETGHTPRAWWTLSMAARDHEVARIAPNTLELRVLGGRMLDGVSERLLRDPALHLHAGDVVPLRGAEVRVLAAQDGGPTRIAVSFDLPLDDPTLWFVTWRDGALRRVSLPPPGVWLRLPRTLGPMEY
jgi:hypothetical protein